MGQERPDPVDPNGLEFWSQLARELQSGANLRAGGTAGAHLSEKHEQLLWECAEGRLSEVHEQQFLELIRSNPAAARRLLAMNAALDTADAFPPGRPESVWQRAVDPERSDGTSVVRQIQDLIVGLAAAGLELVYSAGRPAYAPALARAGEADRPVSLAQEFLLRIGTVQLVIDQVADSRCDVTVIASRLLRPGLADSLVLELIGDRDGLVAKATLSNGRARFTGLTAGNYQLLLKDADQDLDRMTFELRPKTFEPSDTR